MATTRSSSNPDDDGMTAAWAFVWILFAFKMITVALIFYHMRTAATAAILAATTWFWFPVIGLMIAGPLLFRLRLRRVRAKREALRRAEWMVSSDQEIDEQVLRSR